MTAIYQITGNFPNDEDREYLKRSGARYSEQANMWYSEHWINAPIGMICKQLDNYIETDQDVALRMV